MRVLFYNWVDYLDPAGRGGGVSQYQRLLIDAFSQVPGIEPVFLCAGLAYGFRDGAPRWQPLRHGAGATPVRRFTLVNSLPLSPSHHSFGAPEQIAHEPTERAFARFLEEEGPFDIVHFNNLEGLPARVLALRAAFPETRFVLSLHNYYPFCPQVNLWQRERAHCEDFEGGRACVGCLPYQPDPRKVRLAHAVTHRLDALGLRPGVGVFDHAVKPALRTGARAFRWGASRRRARGAGSPGPAMDAPAAAPVAADGAAFEARRREMVDLINGHCDRVLAVSERTAEIARGFGLRADLVQVMRIATDHAPEFHRAQGPARLPRADGTLEIAYLGYMRRDKGFFFLLEALEALPPDLKSRLRVLIAAEMREGEVRARLNRLSQDLAGFRHVDGYARDEMDGLLAGVDLGVVPSLWEDNLPQVALELHCRRIPLLVSDRGGARELGNFPGLQFTAGDRASFEARLRAVIAGGVDLAAYWAAACAPVDPETHIAALRTLYGQVRDAPLRA